MNRSRKIDMTKGPIMKLVVLFALPITFSSLLQMCYSIVDTMVVGNFCESEALAAVATSFQPVEILLCLFLGLGSGTSILVSQSVGAGNTEKLRKVIATASSFLYICAVPLTVIGLLLCPFILKLMRVPSDAFDYAVAYTNILFMATLGNMGYNMNSGILRGLGDSTSSIYFLLISSITNIVLDLVFVVCFHMDVTGVALATAIAMYGSWIFSGIYIKIKYGYLNYRILPRALDKDILFDIAKIGIPLGLNNSLYSVGHILMQSLNNVQGTAFMAACSVATKVTGIANITIGSFASAATTFAGQNLGAEEYKRLKTGGIRIPFCASAVTLTLGIIFTICCRPLLGFFTPDPEVLDLAAFYIRVVLPSTWCWAAISTINNFSNGLGEVKYPMIINLLMLFAVRIPVAYAINFFFEGKYILFAHPASYIFGLVAMLFFYRSKAWKNVKANAHV